jgi:hypothetical protein
MTNSSIRVYRNNPCKQYAVTRTTNVILQHIKHITPIKQITMTKASFQDEQITYEERCRLECVSV